MRQTTLVLLLGVCFGSCELINPAETVPAYVYIEDFDFVAGPSRGTDEVEILDAWVFVNDDALGVYELPALVPILAEGKSEVSLLPGIMLNRIKDNRTNNPFYTPSIFEPELFPGKTDTLKPSSRIRDQVQFLLLEDFESAGHLLDSGDFSRSDFFIVDDPSLVYEGSKSIGFKMESGSERFVGMSSRANPFAKTPPENNLFLEMHYRCTNSFSINLRIQKPGGVIETISHLSLKPSEIWKKVYVNLRPFVNVMEDGTLFWLQFDAQLDDGLNEGEVYFDNLKLMY